MDYFFPVPELRFIVPELTFAVPELTLGHLGSHKVLVVSHFGPFWTTTGRGIRYPWFLDHFLDVFESLVEPQCCFFGPFGFTKKMYYFFNLFGPQQPGVSDTPGF